MIDTNPVLQLNAVTVRAYNKVIFNQLNFRINKGEHWALIGPSGSGKSALLQTIAGKFGVTGGEIKYHFWDDYLARHPNASTQNMTYHQLIALFEPRHHFKNLSNTTEFYYQQRFNSSDVEDALDVTDYLEGVKSVDANAQSWTFTEVISLLKIAHLLLKKTIMLSNGESKRVRLAAALLRNPALLLLDNPMAGLDVASRAEFNDILKEIMQRDTTVVLTAAPNEVPPCITNVAVLNDGVIAAQHKAADFNFSEYAFSQPAVINADAIAELTAGMAEHQFTDIVRMRNVNIRYGANHVLKDVNWHIKPGDHWALQGPNGSGKSTLLSLINGDNPQAYANEIILFDRKRGTGESIWDIKKNTGFVSPELFQFFPADNNCLQVIESGYYDTLGLFRPSVKARQEKALKWMQVLEIDRYAHNLLKNIPAAAQRLCLLARALVKNPPLLIFDEPCQGLDSHQQEHFKKVIDNICEHSPVTLIYVSHYEHEIPGSVDKYLRLRAGEVVEQ